MITSQIHTYKKNDKIREHQKVLINMILKTHGVNFKGENVFFLKKLTQ